MTVMVRWGDAPLVEFVLCDMPLPAKDDVLIFDNPDLLGTKHNKWRVVERIFHIAIDEGEDAVTLVVTRDHT
jgi:hypothetical protein